MYYRVYEVDDETSLVVWGAKASQSTVNGPNVYLCIKCRPFDHISYSAFGLPLHNTLYIHSYIY